MKGIQSVGPRVAKDVHRLLRTIDSFTDHQARVADWDSEGSLQWLVVELTPNSGPYHGGKFLFRVDLGSTSSQYPEYAPPVVCLTNVYHPNIDFVEGCEYDEGNCNICLSLFDEWSSTFGLEDVVQGLLWLLNYPNLDDPLNSLFSPGENDEDFEENVRLSLLGGTVEGVKYERNWVLPDPPDGAATVGGLSTKATGAESNIDGDCVTGAEGGSNGDGVTGPEGGSNGDSASGTEANNTGSASGEGEIIGPEALSSVIVSTAKDECLDEIRKVLTELINNRMASLTNAVVTNSVSVGASVTAEAGEVTQAQDKTDANCDKPVKENNDETAAVEDIVTGDAVPENALETADISDDIEEEKDSRVLFELLHVFVEEHGGSDEIDESAVAQTNECIAVEEEIANLPVVMHVSPSSQLDNASQPIESTTAPLASEAGPGTGPASDANEADTDSNPANNLCDSEMEKIEQQPVNILSNVECMTVAIPSQIYPYPDLDQGQGHCTVQQLVQDNTAIQCYYPDLLLGSMDLMNLQNKDDLSGGYEEVVDDGTRLRILSRQNSKSFHQSGPVITDLCDIGTQTVEAELESNSVQRRRRFRQAVGRFLETYKNRNLTFVAPDFDCICNIFIQTLFGFLTYLRR